MVSMDLEEIVEISWHVLMFAQEEWNILTPDIPQLEKTQAQADLYSELKEISVQRRSRVVRLAELHTRLDLLRMHEDSRGFKAVIRAYEDAIQQLCHK